MYIIYTQNLCLIRQLVISFHVFFYRYLSAPEQLEAFFPDSAYQKAQVQIKTIALMKILKVCSRFHQFLDDPCRGYLTDQTTFKVTFTKWNFLRPHSKWNFLRPHLKCNFLRPHSKWNFILYQTTFKVELFFNIRPHSKLNFIRLHTKWNSVQLHAE